MATGSTGRENPFIDFLDRLDSRACAGGAGVAKAADLGCYMYLEDMRAAAERLASNV